MAKLPPVDGGSPSEWLTGAPPAWDLMTAPAFLCPALLGSILPVDFFANISRVRASASVCYFAARFRPMASIFDWARHVA